MTFARISLTLCVLLGTGLIGACSYNINLREFDYGSAPFTTLKDKKVVIVDDPARIQDGHETMSDLNTYKFRDVRPGLISALQKRIVVSGVSSVEVRTIAQLSEPASTNASDFDVFVRPELKIRSVYDFWTSGCYIEYRLQITNKAGQVLANESGTGKRNFFDGSQAEDKCRIAMAEVFKSVTDRAMALVSAPLSIPR